MAGSGLTSHTLEPSHTVGCVSAGVKRACTITGYFSESDVSALTEILAEHSDKWNIIGISLRLPNTILNDITVQLHMYKPIERLNLMLMEWVVKGHKQAKPPTVEILKEVLGSCIVGLGKEASDLEE